MVKDAVWSIHAVLKLPKFENLSLPGIFGHTCLPIF